MKSLWLREEVVTPLHQITSSCIGLLPITSHCSLQKDIGKGKNSSLKKILPTSCFLLCRGCRVKVELSNIKKIKLDFLIFNTI